MGNAFALILKYGKYLQYLPMLVKLVAFIREAEHQFRGTGTGADKARWVQGQFSDLVTSAEQSGLIGADFARSLRDGSLQLITIFVQGMKDAQGAVPPLPEPTPVPSPSPAPAPSFTYEKVLTTEPNDAQLKTGDQVYQHGEDSQWLVRQAGVGVGAMRPPWVLRRTV